MPIDYKTFKSKYLYPIQDFFGFVSDSYNHIVELKAHLHNDNEHPTIITFYDTFQHKRNHIKKIEPLFHINKNSADLITKLLFNWLNVYCKLKTVIDLYTDVIYRESDSPKIQFLLLAQSAEYYHTLTIGGKSKNLQQRLDELFDKANFFFSELFSDSNFVTKKIKYTRNFYTHYNPKIENKIAKDDELNLLLIILLMLNKIFILKELGISKTEISHSIKSQKGYYSQTVSLLKKFNYT